jgi:large repetitive protein
MIPHRWHAENPAPTSESHLFAPVSKGQVPMSRSSLSSWFGFLVARKKTSGAASRAYRQAGRRALRVEQLEDRQMLSVSITAVPAGVAAHSAAAAAANASPTIGGVVASATLGKLTWNAADSSGVASSGLTIGGVPVSDVNGPWTAANGLNYSWNYNSLPAGTYAYVITATDVLGNASQYTGTLTVGSGAGPTISKAVAATAQGVISWNAAASGGAASCSITLDGAAVTDVYGPWAATSGATYEGVIGTVAEGVHSYVITATDNAGNTSHYTSWFLVGTTVPTINSVVLLANQGAITWNAAAVTGIKTAALTIDGVSVSNISGPWDAASGVNFQGTFGALPVGDHTYTITVTSGAGLTTKSVGAFAVSGPSIGSIVVSTATGCLTWNVANSNGVSSSSLTIDGNGVGVSGPYTAANGYNFAGALGALAAGSHTYVINATDNSGRFSRYSGTFLVTNLSPKIGQVGISVARGLISWNAYDLDGVSCVSVTVDGVAKKILGPYKAASGYNYQGAFGALASGSHVYVIRAVDTAGNASQYSGTFLA